MRDKSQLKRRNKSPCTSRKKAKCKNTRKNTKQSNTTELPSFKTTIREFRSMKDPSFTSSEQDAENAVILNYLNAGLFRFSDLNKVENPINRTTLMQEITSEMLGEHAIKRTFKGIL